MHLSNPLATLTGDLTGSILEALSRADTDFTGRQVARIVGAQHPNGVRKALLRLVDSGLVTARFEQRATLFRANRDHVLWPAVDLALSSRAELLDRVTNLLHSYGDLVVSAAVFGSAADSTATAESDLDCVVVVRDDGTATRESTRADLVNDLLHSVPLWSGNPAQVFDVTEADLAEMVSTDDAMLQSWRDRSRTLAGVPFVQLVT